MAYEVIARKWRPQQFDDVVGQGHVTQTLKNAIATDRVAHAYLFVGPRGTGKTTTARILAKALNCEKGPTVTPCDQCDSCREIMAGSHLDVLEIDGASNTGVDHVRDLRENAMFTPARGPFKIYIIDEVHMLSAGAFNALLKTLEEPPPHVKFVFATTEPQKLPATILSRCQRFDLRRIPAPEIMGRLREIAQAEEVQVEEAALLAIARGAEGGMRDAQSALDQLIAFRGKTITEDDVLSVFGLVAQQTLDDLVTAILEGDVARLVEIVAELDEGGKDMQRLTLELLECFRNLLVCLHAGADSKGLDLADIQRAWLEKAAAKVDSGQVLRIVGHLMEAEGRMRYALSKRTLLEVALIRAARATRVASLNAVLKQLNELKAQLGSPAGAPAAEKKTPDPALTAPAEAPPGPQAAPSGRAAPPRPKGEEAGKKEVALLVEGWHELVDRVGRAAPLARNYLLDAKPVEVGNDVVTIAFDPEFADNRDKLDHPRNVAAVEKVLRSLLGRAVKVRFSVLDSKDTLPGDIKFAGKEAGGKEGRKTGKAKAKYKTKQEWVQDPVVRETLEMFNGEIVDVRE